MECHACKLLLVETRSEHHLLAKTCSDYHVPGRTSLPPPDPLDEDLQRADRLSSAAALTNGRISPQLLLSCGLPGAWGLPLMQPDAANRYHVVVLLHTCDAACPNAQALAP